MTPSAEDQLAAAWRAADAAVNTPATTEERILVAAEQCVTRLGIRRTSMTDVAAQAGVSRGAVYFHFSDKASLIDAVMARVAGHYVASSEAAVRARSSLADQVAEAAVFIRLSAGERILIRPLPADDEQLLATLMTANSRHLTSEWVDFWLPYLDDAEARGEIRPGLDHREVGEWIVRLLMSFAVMPAVTFDADDPESVRSFVRTYAVAGFAR
ncbi:MAG TPA: TetR/AcrR family transcriptional regulator [Acidimicrobiales bacterium]|jgi:AcrR family transcriptional regulator|nr:TetR/AcrR family transcriptional regulator [Acidimicrobiales bacterium]